ncbi:MAG: hypothetical protein ACOCQD_02795 [archaeon]
MRRKVRIPIYNVTLYIVVKDTSLELYKEVKKKFYSNLFVVQDNLRRFDGAILRGNPKNKDKLAIFLKTNPTYNILAHEVFHLTHRILDWSGAKFEHEHAAFLHGYLFDLVLKNVKKMRNTNKINT